jgi:hypothetical protein
MGTPNLDRITLSKRVGGQLNVGLTASVITDALVSANSASLTNLMSNILSAAQATGRPDVFPIAIKTIEAIQKGKDLSLWAENHGHSSVSSMVSATDSDSTTRRIGIWS